MLTSMAGSLNKHERNPSDVFLSYNSLNLNNATKLARMLKRRRVKVWMDQWEMYPGDEWQKTLDEQIRSCRCAVILVGKHGLGPWQNREITALLQQSVARPMTLIPVLLPCAPEDVRLPIFLQQNQWADFRKGFDKNETKRLVAGILRIGEGQAPTEDNEKQQHTSPRRLWTGKIGLAVSLLVLVSAIVVGALTWLGVFKSDESPGSGSDTSSGRNAVKGASKGTNKTGVYFRSFRNSEVDIIIDGEWKARLNPSHTSTSFELENGTHEIIAGNWKKVIKVPLQRIVEIPNSP